MSPMSLDQIGSLPPALQQAILDGPALAPPPGVAPDFAHPPNGNAKTLAIASLCLGLTTFAVMVRVYARFFRMKNALFQDYLAIAAYGLYLAYSYTMFWQVYTHGFFLHQWDIQVRDLAGVFRMSIVAANLYAVVIMVMKACILMDWSALFVPRGTRNGFWWTCHIFMALNVLFYTTVIAVANASCTPYRRLWDKTVPGSKCLDITLIYLVSAAINVVLDLVTLVLPQKVIWTLHMTTKRKISVSCIFVVGVLTCLAAILRLYYNVSYHLSDDKTYGEAPFAMCATAEMACSFLVFSGPSASKAFSSFGVAGIARHLAAVSQSWKSWSSQSNHWLSARRGSFSPWNSRRATGTGTGTGTGMSTAWDSLEQLEDPGPRLDSREVGRHERWEMTDLPFDAHTASPPQIWHGH